MSVVHEDLTKRETWYMGTYEDQYGDRHPMYLGNVHPRAACEGRHCVIHDPSDHHMRDWPLNWRQDKGIMERLCPHGIGHDDPDDVAYRVSQAAPEDRDYVGIHGCDGCCFRG